MICPLTLGALKAGCCYWCGGELPPRRSKWCSAKCVKRYYSNHNWNGARKAAKRRDGYRCLQCGSKDSLEVNHIVALADQGHSGNYGWSCRNHLDGLVTLCHACHVIETARQRKERNVVSVPDPLD